MKIHKQLIGIILLLSTCNTYCCKCKNLGSIENLRLISYRSSDLVFLGELMETDTTDCSYEFKIIELFKGKCKTSIIKGKYFGTCSLFPNKKDNWIVYADFHEDNTINMSVCLASRSESEPICMNCYILPAPPPPKANSKQITEFEKRIEELRIKAQEDWYLEIELLRSRKEYEHKSKNLSAKP